MNSSEHNIEDGNQMFNEFYEEAQIESAKEFLAMCGIKTIFVHYKAKEAYSAFDMGCEL